MSYSAGLSSSLVAIYLSFCSGRSATDFIASTGGLSCHSLSTGIGSQTRLDASAFRHSVSSASKTLYCNPGLLHSQDPCSCHHSGESMALSLSVAGGPTYSPDCPSFHSGLYGPSFYRIMGSSVAVPCWLSGTAISETHSVFWALQSLSVWRLSSGPSGPSEWLACSWYSSSWQHSWVWTVSIRNMLKMDWHMQSWVPCCCHYVIGWLTRGNPWATWSVCCPCMECTASSFFCHWGLWSLFQEWRGICWCCLSLLSSSLEILITSDASSQPSQRKTAYRIF